MSTWFEFGALWFEVFWKSGVALGAALCISWMLRSRSADVRRLVFSTAIVAMFSAAAATPVLPSWTAVTPIWFHWQRPAPAAVAVPSQSSLVDDASEVTTPVGRSIPLQTSSRRIDLNAWLIPLIWFAGAAALLTRFAVNLRALRRLRKASDAVTDAGILALVAAGGRHVRLWRNGAIGAPVTWGIARPVILVPADFEALPAESRDAVIRHEMAHIRAHDFLMRGLAEIARALIWFQPLVWIVWRRLREEQELACDNRVLAAGGRPSAYAKLLLEWDGRPGLDSSIAVGISHRSCLKRRLFALLDTDLRRNAVSGAGVASALLLALAAALPLAAVSFTQAVPVHSAPAPAVQSALPAPMPGPLPPAQLAQTQPAQTPVKAPESEPAAQSAAEPRPRFEVASVKACKPEDLPRGGGRNGGAASPGDPGLLRFTCVPVDRLIRLAYLQYASAQTEHEAFTFSRRIFNQDIAGEPGWTQSERYSIEAKPEPPQTIATMRGPMLQTLLEERFRLKLHREIKEVSVYDLIVGKGGPKLTRTKEGGCIPIERFDPMAPRPGPTPPCGPFHSDTGGGMVTYGSTLANLCAQFSVALDRDVIDKTGLTGQFDIHLQLTNQDLFPWEARPQTSATSVAPEPFDPTTSIITAVQKLGLRLEPAKAAVDHLVIDHIERPSEN